MINSTISLLIKSFIDLSLAFQRTMCSRSVSVSSDSSVTGRSSLSRGCRSLSNTSKRGGSVRWPVEKTTLLSSQVNTAATSLLSLI